MKGLTWINFARATALLLRRLRLDLRGAAGRLIRLFGAGMLLITILAAIENSRTIGSPGLVAFRWIVWCDAFLIGAASITVFAAIIAGEREGGTLGLLRMTGTSPLTLLLGQGMSGILIGCLLLLVQFPFIVLTITLGGVLWNQVLAAFLGVLAHLVLSAGIGLFFSTACKRVRLSGVLCPGVPARALAWAVVRPVDRRPDEHRGKNLDCDRAGNRHLLELRRSTPGLDAAERDFDVVRHHRTRFGSILVVDRRRGRPIRVKHARSWTTGRSSRAVVADHAFALEAGAGPCVAGLPISGKDFRQFMGGQRGLIARLIIYTGVPLGVAWGMNHYTDARLDADDFGAMVFWFGLAFFVIELNAVASRLFRNELAEQTWSTLTLLPRPFVSVVGLKLVGAAVGLIPAVVIPAFALAVSETARETFTRSPRYEWVIPIVMILFFVCATSLASMTLPNLPPTVLVFCGLIAYFVHYGLTILAVVTLQSRQMMNHDRFNLLYGSFWSLVSAAFLIVAFVRLRKLTASN